MTLKNARTSNQHTHDMSNTHTQKQVKKSQTYSPDHQTTTSIQPILTGKLYTSLVATNTIIIPMNEWVLGL